MRNKKETKLKVVMSLFFILLTTASGLSEDIDVAVSDILLPKRIYLNQRVTISIMLANNSDIDLAGCTLNITAEDGSSVNQQLLLEKNAQGKVELQWVPQKEGEIKLEVNLLPPQGMHDTDIKNNQLIKTIQVHAK